MITEFFTNSIFFGVLVSLTGYEIGLYLKKKTRLAVLNPLLISILFVIGILLAFHIDYDVYKNGATYLSYLLTPATVCLAVPLYKQIHLLKQYGAAIGIAVLAGTVTSLLGILVLSILFRLDHSMYGQDAGGDDCKAAHSALYFTEFNGLACSNCMGRGAERQPARDTVFNVEPF